MRRRWLVAWAALALAACSPTPDPASPALWRVEGPHGESGYLFGTIHALERPAAWRTSAVAAALAQSKSIVVEVAGLADGKAIKATFDRLGRSPGHPSLSARLPASLHARLDAALTQGGFHDGDFGEIETWMAALMLAHAQEPGAENGVDRALLASAKGKRVVELEGADAQLAIFDRLSEADQRALLAAVVNDGGAPGAEGPDLADAWRTGDMARIEKETRTGLLADPDLRAALYTARNRAWAARISAMLRLGDHPFVAVGAAHMAGAEGLPALLAGSGWKVTRIE